MDVAPEFSVFRFDVVSSVGCDTVWYSDRLDR